MNTIIVIDDDADEGLLFRVAVGDFAVIHAFQNPDEAVLFLAGCKEFPDLILVDAKMPKASGFEVASRIRVLYPDANIVLMSGSGFTARPEFPFMLKAMTLEEINEGIRRHLHGEQSRR